MYIFIIIIIFFLRKSLNDTIFIYVLKTFKYKINSMFFFICKKEEVQIFVFLFNGKTLQLLMIMLAVISVN